ncbi:MAG TPA: hypothetical protein DEO98_04240 [Legionellales bacterium]|nr:hypothetical protein [Legionellales bacterium]|tara:strand:- start:613 stop:2667 length:2055 start_codon:yes stop_codon:yes gene_type:complete
MFNETFKLTDILDEFYQGLYYLALFETKQAKGSMAHPSFMLNKVIALFDAACDQGHVIAPYFLHYIAQTYEGWLEIDDLPQLEKVPCIIEKGEDWLTAYKKFVELYQRIDKTFGEAKIVTAQNERQAQQKAKTIMRHRETLVAKIKELSLIHCGLTNLFIAQLMQLLPDTAITQKSIMYHYERGVERPNIWAMYEYYNYLNSHKIFDTTNPSHQRLYDDLLLIKNHDIVAVMNHYAKQDVSSKLTPKWIVANACNGHIDSILYVALEHLDIKNQADEASKSTNLATALLCVDWIVNHLNKDDFMSTLTSVSSFIDSDIMKNQIDKVALLTLCLFKLFVYTTIHDYRSSKFEQFITQFEKNLYLLWTNNPSLPAYLHYADVFEEMGVVLLQHKNYIEAEKFFRQALLKEPNNASYHCKLASSLNLQDKSYDEQIIHFLFAANQGNKEALEQLFIICAVQDYGTEENLEQLYLLLQQLDDEVHLFIDKTILLQCVMFELYKKHDPDCGHFVQYRFEKIEQNYQLTIDFNGEGLKKALAEKDEVSMPDITPNTTLDTTPDATEPPIKTDLDKTSVSKISSVTSKNTSFFDPLNKFDPTEAKNRRARKALEKINKIPVKNLTLRDLVKAQKAYETLHGKKAIKVSAKGKTSGSRAQIGRLFCHIPHGGDRPSPGHQQAIKNQIASLQP